MLEVLKSAITSKGVNVDEFLKSKWPDGEWIIENEQIIYNAHYKPLNVLYKWKVVGETIETISGKSGELTPQFDPRLQKINEKKNSLNQEELKVFEFVQEYEKNGIETKEAITKVSKDIGLSEDEILDIYDKVSRGIY